MGKEKTAAQKLDELTVKEMVENKTINFSEAFSSVQKKNPQLAKEYLIELGFSEPETTTEKPSEKLGKLTEAKMKKQPDLSYSAAFSECQKENPQLTIEYMQELQ